ncbi:MAG: 16S rRNA (guanine(527)-N(7))-methyltransferase RsmG [Bacilli bacterium]
MNQIKFIEELEKIGINLNEIQLEQLNQYYELLIEYNKVMNLTGITEKEQVYLKHFYDSLTIIKVINLKKINSLCDIGTGAGFPGLVIKIVFPNIKITLLDSLNKRIEFLNQVIKELKLENIKTIHTRAEEYSIKNRNKFDITTARAVAHLSILLEYAIPMTKINGYFIALKGNVKEEIKEIENAIKELKLELEKIVELNLPVEESNRTIISFKKLKDIKKYPRKNSEIKRQRL